MLQMGTAAFNFAIEEEHAVSALVQNVSQPTRVLRLPQVCAKTGLCRSMIYQMESELRFPRRIKIGTRAVGWLEEEVQAWLDRRVELSRASAVS